MTVAPFNLEFNAKLRLNVCVFDIAATCSDGIKNQDEKGVDCGGRCLMYGGKKCGKKID